MKSPLSNCIITGLLLSTLAPAAWSAEPAATKPTAAAQQQRAEDFQRGQQEAMSRKLTHDRLLREQGRLKDRQAAAEKDLLQLRVKLSSVKQFLADPEHANSDKEKKEAAALEAAIKTAETELAGLDAAVLEAAARLYADTTTPNTDRPIIVGDVLQLFAGDDAVNGLYAVRRGGYVILPRVGRVYVVGKPVADAKKSIEESLAGAHLRADGLTVTCARLPMDNDASGVVYLAGEFNKPGTIGLEGENSTVLSAILKSGGLTPSADLTHVKLIRMVNGNNLVEEMNAQSILDGSGSMTDLVVVPGDIIMVSSFAPTVNVTGNVVRPGALKLQPQEEMGAFAAIVKSGGFAKSASPEGVYVLRDYGNGQKSKIPVNIKDVQAAKSPDIVLRGSDIVVVPESR